MTHRTAALVAIVGGAMMAVGSFMPWVSARTGLGTIEIKGTDGDGVITLVVGALVALLALVHLDRPAPGLARLGVISGGLVGIIIAVADFSAAADRVAQVQSDFAAASVGAGLYILGIGALAAIIGGFRMEATVPTERAGRVCVNCGKTVAADRERFCNHCGEPFAVKV